PVPVHVSASAEDALSHSFLLKCEAVHLCIWEGIADPRELVNQMMGPHLSESGVDALAQLCESDLFREMIDREAPLTNEEP
ncbi:MAG: hypothetical protein ACRER2_03985, partial [Methylococcales bacterium]